MTEIYLVRHGQASFGTEDYDRLSPLGRLQCQHLGARWRQMCRRFDAVYSGPLLRQKDSCLLSVPDADPGVSEALREYDADALISAYTPRRQDTGTDARPVDMGRNAGIDHYRTVLSEALGAWCRGDPPLNHTVESWDEFIARAGNFLGYLTDRHHGARHIALFTSGGVIAAALCATLQLSPETTIGMSWHLRNASVTRLHFQHGRWSMASYNETGHLEYPEQPELLTVL